MTFEEAWKQFIPAQTTESCTPEQLQHLRNFTLAFYKAGEIQGVTNVSFLVEEAAAMRMAMDKEKGRIQ